MDNRFFINEGTYSLADIAKYTESTIVSPRIGALSSSSEINSICPMDVAESGQVTFFTNKKYRHQLQDSKASACFINEEDQELLPDGMYGLVSDNPYYAYALAMDMFYSPRYSERDIRSDQSLISSNSKIGEGAIIGASAVIGEDVEIGNNTLIEPGAVICAGVKIGDNCRIGSNVTIKCSILGNNVIVLPGAQIGQDGFGFATKHGVHKKILHVGRVVIGNDVEIGANTTIDRGVYHDTVISDGVRIDNLVQLGHNVQIGKGSIIVAQAGIAGSSKIGDYCAIGGQVGVAGHITIGNQAQVAAQGGVISDLEDGAIVGGTPSVPLRQWHKQSIILKQLASGKKK